MVQKRDGRLIRGGAFTEAEITQYWGLPGCEGGMRASPKTVAQLLEEYPDPGPVCISVDDCELAQKGRMASHTFFSASTKKNEQCHEILRRWSYG
eukprot:8844377-Pyramimonas_sp.AAC.1